MRYEVRFDLEVKEKLIEELNAKTLADGFWSDQRGAQVVINDLNYNRSIVNEYNDIKKALEA